MAHSPLAPCSLVAKQPFLLPGHSMLTESRHVWEGRERFDGRETEIPGTGGYPGFLPDLFEWCFLRQHQYGRILPDHCWDPTSCSGSIFCTALVGTLLGPLSPWWGIKCPARLQSLGSHQDVLCHVRLLDFQVFFKKTGIKKGDEGGKCSVSCQVLKEECQWETDSS